ncbi:unnamed protein product [marine sediment metagenome]|uniref:Uncharacterized protein n=1 Tax=marine sediment metagenome TaxID=412755 RepID=X1RZ94_9ZZZZ
MTAGSGAAVFGAARRAADATGIPRWVIGQNIALRRRREAEIRQEERRDRESRMSRRSDPNPLIPGRLFG